MTQEQVIIIGGGPSGLTAGLYCARADLHPIIVTGEVTPTNIPGGQLMITTDVENYPGFASGIEGPALIQQLTSQALKYGCRIVEQHANEFNFDSEGGLHRVRIGKEWVSARCVILANGASAKWLGVKGEYRFKNRGISACATCDGPLPCFRDQTICVVGGGDSACEEALFLSKFASHVFLIHRRESLRASKVMQRRVHDNRNITVLWNTVVVGYKGEDNLEGVLIEDLVSHERCVVECKGLFMAIGHSPNTRELESSGLDMTPDGYIQTTNNVFTNRKGVFACGDVHDTHYRQAITAAGFGCMAALETERYLAE